ncbi:MAG: dihydropyrimidinase [Bacteroidales bacterium]|jgi:dihydropyrimidinase|nr:dihydropyrimidinase [Bacteroidales bacterium]
MNILIQYATIVTSTRAFNADIFISGGKIVQIGSSLEISEPIDRVFDASSHYVFPGGIDPHVHMHLPTPAGYSADDFATGSKAALIGGTTTLLDFVTPKKGESLIDALIERRAEANRSLCDYSFHVSPIEWTNTTGQEIKDCIEAGIPSFKVYMAYKDTLGLDDEDIFRVMHTLGNLGGIVTLHCESGDNVEKLRNKLAQENKLSPEYHPVSRPVETETEAVQMAIAMAKITKCPIYIVHTSAGRSIEIIEKAQQEKQKVFSETCPQYLFLDDSKYNGPFEDTAKYILSPPLRKKEDQNILWDAIKRGIVKTIGTDHCPFNYDQKKTGILDFRKIPNGAGGVEHRMKLLFTHGVLKNRISFNQFVDITSTQAAKIFGLYPQKGEIAVGSDADLILWNPKIENIISTYTHHQNCDQEIYEGFKTIGAPEVVIARGQIVVDNEKLVSSPQGKFLKRKAEY